MPHRDFVSQPPGGGRTIIVYGGGESFSIVDLDLVTELEVLEKETPGASGPGPSR